MNLRRTTALLAVAVLCTSPVLSGAQKAGGNRPIGTWSRTVDQFMITFDIQADSLTIVFKNDDGNGLTVHADYGVSKDGVLFLRMSKVEKKGIDDGPSEGELFSFKYKVSGEELVIDDLRGRTDDNGKRLVQGTYKKTKK